MVILEDFSSGLHKNSVDNYQNHFGVKLDVKQFLCFYAEKRKKKESKIITSYHNNLKY